MVDLISQISVENKVEDFSFTENRRTAPGFNAVMA